MSDETICGFYDFCFERIDMNYLETDCKRPAFRQCLSYHNKNSPLPSWYLGRKDGKAHSPLSPRGEEN